MPALNFLGSSVRPTLTSVWTEVFAGAQGRSQQRSGISITNHGRNPVYVNYSSAVGDLGKYIIQSGATKVVLAGPGQSVFLKGSGSVECQEVYGDILTADSIGAISQPLVTPVLTRATATGSLAAAPCRLVDAYVSASVAGALILWDNTAASGTSILGTIQFGVGITSLRSIIPDGGVRCNNGIFFTLSSGTAEVTVGTVAI
jgi:hypothetical protein